MVLIQDQERLLRLREVMSLTGLSRNKILLMMAAGEFPLCCWAGPKSRRWKNSRIEAWIENLVPRPEF